MAAGGVGDAGMHDQHVLPGRRAHAPALRQPGEEGAPIDPQRDAGAVAVDPRGEPREAGPFARLFRSFCAACCIGAKSGERRPEFALPGPCAGDFRRF